MISCFKGGNSSVTENGVNSSRTAVYTSVSDFDNDRVPQISKIVESMRHYDVFKYSAYRTAFKLRTIQKASKLHLVDLSVISSILKEYENVNSIEETISLSKAENLLSTLYIEAGKMVGFPEEPNVMALLFLAFVQNTFVKSENSILLVHLKIALTLFSSAKLTEKYKYFFYYCSNGSDTISKQNLILLLNCFAKIAEIVGEQVTFGTHLVPAAIKNIQKFSKGEVTLKKFVKWLLMEPQTLVWISTIHRIAVSEKSQHFVSCDNCHVNPLIGLRYRCLQCIRYNLCQNCFLSGQLNKRHKERHPVQEFCHTASAWQETKATFNAVKNNLPFTRTPSKPYLSFEDDSFCESMKDINKNSSRNSLIYHTIKKSTTAYIIKELSSIINKLEDDKRQISAVAEEYDKENQQDNSQSKREPCNGHKLQSFNSSLESQLERLKELLQSLKSSKPIDDPNIISPVPHAAPFNKLDNFLESTPLNSCIIPMELKKTPIRFSPSTIHTSERSLEKQRENCTSLDLSDLLSSRDTNMLSDAKASSSTFYLSKPSEKHYLSNSLGPDEFSFDSSLSNLSERIAKFDDSKLSPLYLYTSTEIEESLSKNPLSCYNTETPMKSSPSQHSLSKAASTFTLNKEQSLEAMELELQAMLQQIEQLLPQVLELSCDSSKVKNQVATALSDMEYAVKNLSHISLSLSAGSTDL